MHANLLICWMTHCLLSGHVIFRGYINPEITITCAKTGLSGIRVNLNKYCTASSKRNTMLQAHILSLLQVINCLKLNNDEEIQSQFLGVYSLFFMRR